MTGHYSDATSEPIPISEIRWSSAGGGSIGSGGIYWSGADDGYCDGFARHASGLEARKQVHVPPAPPAIVDFRITPTDVVLDGGAAATFRGTVRYSSGVEKSTGFQFSAAGGSVDANGRYTAGDVAGSFEVRATDPASGTVVQ